MDNSPVQILAHRGVWNAEHEKNGLVACKQAFALGYGIEVDVRDVNGTLMVAHDINDLNTYPFANLCNVLRSYPECCVAINIKSCGLQSLLQKALSDNNVTNYFTFDMAIPDLLVNLKHGITSFTRQSEYEPEPVLYTHVEGVWLDMFEADWISDEIITKHLKNGKKIAIVSPELHKRDHLLFWEKLRSILQSADTIDKALAIYLCTDHPQEAHHYFNG